MWPGDVLRSLSRLWPWGLPPPATHTPSTLVALRHAEGLRQRPAQVAAEHVCDAGHFRAQGMWPHKWPQCQQKHFEEPQGPGAWIWSSAVSRACVNGLRWCYHALLEAGAPLREPVVLPRREESSPPGLLGPGSILFLGQGAM